MDLELLNIYNCHRNIKLLGDGLVAFIKLVYYFLSDLRQLSLLLSPVSLVFSVTHTMIPNGTVTTFLLFKGLND